MEKGKKHHDARGEVGSCCCASNHGCPDFFFFLKMGPKPYPLTHWHRPAMVPHTVPVRLFCPQLSWCPVVSLLDTCLSLPLLDYSKKHHLYVMWSSPCLLRSLHEGGQRREVCGIVLSSQTSLSFCLRSRVPIQPRPQCFPLVRSSPQHLLGLVFIFNIQRSASSLGHKSLGALSRSLSVWS